jgi:S-adenosylmethionine hydrolase
VIYIDSLGNLVTNITREHLDLLGSFDDIEVTLLGKTICGIGATYAASPSGALIALFDSQGRLEIAMVNGCAAKELAACPGTAVDVRGAS